MRPRRRLLMATFAAVILFNLLELTFPKLLQLYVDSIAGNPLRFLNLPLEFLASSHARMWLIPSALLIIAAARWAVTYNRSVYQTRLGQGALFDLRSYIFNTMQNLSFAYHDAAHSGTLVSNIVEDVNYANMFFQRGLMLLLESSAYIIISYVIMYVICPAAALASMGLCLLASSSLWFYFRHGHKVYGRTKMLFAAMVQLFSENMEGHLVVKGFGVSENQEERYSEHVDTLHRTFFKERMFATYLSQAYVWAMVFAIPLVIGIAYFEGRAGRWDMTEGRLFLIFFLQTGLRLRMWGFTRAIDQTLQFTITAERLGKLLRSDAYLDDSGTETIPDEPATIEVQDATFAYGNYGHSLKSISLQIKEGSSIGLVGPTGSGKSTLALLLCRFYDPDSGQILFDHRDIRNFSLTNLRNQFSLVFQDTFLFSASIRDNIAYGRPDASYEDIVNAASIAQIHSFVMSLPDGYDTEIGERGVTLSGGQRQRISIARAILRKPRFLILDACTSALDAVTEKAIQDSLASLSETTTTVIIAHRYSSIERVDCVYVLDGGRIIESGPPDELRAPGTAFNRVIQS